MKPSFVIGGATYSGVRTIRDLLGANSSLFLPARVTPSFFCQDRRFEKGEMLYKRFFQNAGAHQIAGELSPAYFEHGIIINGKGQYSWQPKDDSALRIKKLYPEMKLIFALRNPIDRAYAGFQNARKAKREKANSLEAAIQEELEGKRSKETHPLCYLYRNSYAVHMDHWKKLFGGKQIHICTYEDLMNDPVCIINGMEEFIGVRPRNFRPESLMRIKGEAEKPTLFERLKGRYETLEALEDMILQWGPFQNYVQKRSQPQSAEEPESSEDEKDTDDLSKKSKQKTNPKDGPDAELRAKLIPHFRPDVEKLQELLGHDDLLSLWKL